MKASKKFFIAIATTGFVAPLAAPAQEVASLSGRAAISSYTQQQVEDRFMAWDAKNQVTNVNQFSDVQPTDWAYQALSNLVEKYGCVAGYPNGSFKGGNAMTRFEAAALLNACLDRVSEVTDDLQRLINEFKAELATLKGRVDGLDAKVGKLEAQQFSTTTKLKGEANMILGGIPGYRFNGADAGNTTFNYDLRLSLDTSYTGQDLLRTRLRSGNFSTNPFANKAQPFNLDKAVAFDSAVKIDRLFYTFPVGKKNNIKLTVGALVRNTELAWLATAYKSSILDAYETTGTSGVYNKAVGQGFGFQWKQNVAKGKPFFVFNANYVAESGNDSAKGVFNSDGAQNAMAQIGYKASNWGAAFGYRYGSFGTNIRDGNGVAGLALANGQYSNSIAFNAYWQPTKTGWMPSISAGYGYNFVDGGATGSLANVTSSSKSWMVGFQWDNAFVKTNAAGIAFGQPSYTTGANQSNPWLIEWFYRIQATDNISITPTLFYGSGIANGTANSATGSAFSGLGGVIQTTFKF